MEEIVSTIKYIEAGEDGIETVDYALAMAEMFFSLKGAKNRLLQVSYTRSAVVEAVNFIENMAKQQEVCPCYWIYLPLHTESWRKRCQELLKKSKNYDDGKPCRNIITAKLVGEEMARRLGQNENNALAQMYDIVSNLMRSITRLNKILSNPTDDALCLLYGELLSYLEDTDSITYEVEQSVSKLCSRCKNGRPQASTVESWMDKLRKECLEVGLGEYYDILSSAETAAERKLAAMRYIYNDARDVEKVLPPMMVLERYNRYEALIDEVRAKTEKKAGAVAESATDEACGDKPDASSEAVSRLNSRLKNNVSADYDAEVVDQIWSALMQDRFFVQKIKSESVNSYDGVNLSVYAKVVGRLCYHGIIKGRQRVISSELFGDIPNCCEETLRRDIGVGQMLDSISDEVIKDAIDRVARPLRV